MNKQGRVLVVDDLENWREELAETLQRDGFYVDTASTASEALKSLSETLYHLLVLDIRMDEADPNNTDGLDLLRELDKQGLSEALQIIMLSAHDTKEQVRTAFKEHGVADFLSKDKFNNREFLQDVRQIFAQKIKSNLALDIHYQQIKRAEDALANLEINSRRLKKEPAMLKQIAIELEDLLQRLFSQAESILVRPIGSGQSTTGVLWVQPFYLTGGGRPVIVKFGDFRKIEEEHHNFKTYVQPFIGGGRNTTVIDVRRTPHLSGIMYSLLGTDDDRLEDFGAFYQGAEIGHIRNVLDQLFLDTCATWYANANPLRPYDLSSDYLTMFDYTKEKVERALAELQKYVQIKTVQGKQVLDFKALDSGRTFRNPIKVLDEPPFKRPAYTCTTHGDFNQHNIFVDSNEHTWLIDFQSTAQGHIFRDVAQLDSEIRYFLLKPEEATLAERLKMEEELCRAERFSQLSHLATNLPTQNRALARTYAVVIHLRTLARKLIAKSISDDMSEYYIALFYNALNTLRFYGLSSSQREHALLSASLFADRITL